jgi:hypothetical protein
MIVDNIMLYVINTYNFYLSAKKKNLDQRLNNVDFAEDFLS